MIDICYIVVIHIIFVMAMIIVDLTNIIKHYSVRLGSLMQITVVWCSVCFMLLCYQWFLCIIVYKWGLRSTNRSHRIVIRAARITADDHFCFYKLTIIDTFLCMRGTNSILSVIAVHVIRVSHRPVRMWVT